MKKNIHWSKPVAFLALVSITLVGLKMPANAVPSPTPTQSTTPTPSRPTSAGLVGQCRAAKKATFIYPQRSTSGTTVRSLAINEKVTLADNGSSGWIAISSPAIGYVQASDLKRCDTVTTTTPPTGTTPVKPANLCRKVIYPGAEGLAIRSTPDRSASSIGGIKTGITVTLKTDPPQYTVDSAGRSWVEITAPIAGWITDGYPSTKNVNLGPCS